MIQTSARLLRLLSLFQSRRYWSGAELSSELEITPRTVRRDVDRLRSLGYPVHAAAGTGGGYQLGAGKTLPPLLLDDDEAVAVALGLRMASNGTVAGMEESSVRALGKLEQVLPTRLAKRVAALHGSIDSMAHTGPRVEAEVLSAIAGACRERVCIRFLYKGRESAGTRTVEPHRLVYTGWRWYLVAWDAARNDWRTFRPDRMEGRILPGARFTARTPPLGDFAAYVARSLSSVPHPCRATVTVYLPAESLARRLPHAAGLIEAIDAQSCLLHTGAQSFEILAMHLALLGADFRVGEPAELVEQLERVRERYRRAVPQSK